MKKVLISFLTAVLLQSFFAPAVFAAAEEQPKNMSVEQLEEAYMPVLRAYKDALSADENILVDAGSEYGGAIGFGGFFPENDPLYAFFDINKDGVPEMLIGTGNGADDFAVVQLFYLTEGKIGKFFDEKYDYRQNAYIGADGTIMTNGRIPAAMIGSTLVITTIGDSWTAPEAYEGCFFDAIAGGVTSAPDEAFYEMAQDMFDSLRDAGYTEVSVDEMDARREAYIANGLDLSSLDWHEFTDAVTAEDPASEMIEGEHTYKVYRAPLYGEMEQSTTLTLESDGDRFVLTVNLLEAWGTIYGTYVLDEQALILNIESKNFSGWGYDEIKTVDLSVKGNEFISNDPYFSIDNGSVFQYEGSYIVSDESGTGVVTGSAVNLRNGPGLDYTILYVVEKDKTVAITGKCGGWYQVQYGKSVTVGYMSADYIEIN